MVVSNFFQSSKKIALDTNLFIYVFEQHPEFGEKAKAILEHIENGFADAVASSVSLTDVYGIIKVQRSLLNQYVKET